MIVTFGVTYRVFSHVMAHKQIFPLTSPSTVLFSAFRWMFTTSPTVNMICHVCQTYTLIEFPGCYRFWRALNGGGKTTDSL